MITNTPTKAMPYRVQTYARITSLATKIEPWMYTMETFV
jgi:hypothetical protein